MNEIIALENEIREALPTATGPAVAPAHDILCNAWRGPGERIERLRAIAKALRA